MLLYNIDNIQTSASRIFVVLEHLKSKIMKTLIKYFGGITLTLMLVLMTQSCTNKIKSIDDSQVRLMGTILDEITGEPMRNAKFQLLDHSTDPQNIGDIFGFTTKETVETDRDGKFDLIYTLKNSTDKLFYSFGDQESKSQEEALTISEGETVDLGDLYAYETVQILFDITDLDLTYDNIVYQTIKIESGFQYKNNNTKINNNIIKGYLFPNQENTVRLSQQTSSGLGSPFIFEMQIGDVFLNQVIVLKK